jgi:hypothetical protein
MPDPIYVLVETVNDMPSVTIHASKPAALEALVACLRKHEYSAVIIKRAWSTGEYDEEGYSLNVVEATAAGAPDLRPGGAGFNETRQKVPMKTSEQHQDEVMAEQQAKVPITPHWLQEALANAAAPENPASPAATADTFDLTPRGAMTVEGRQRIAKAQDGLHDALARCAEALREMTDAMEDKEGGIAPFLMKGGMASEDAHDLSRDALKGLRLWKDAGETFVRAVAGAPERRSRPPVA